jgi:hypothetical protein
MTHEKRTKLRRQQDLIDAAASKRGQAEAARYLRSKEVPATRGNIRAGIAFMMLSTATLVILLAL